MKLEEALSIVKGSILKEALTPMKTVALIKSNINLNKDLDPSSIANEILADIKYDPTAFNNNKPIFKSERTQDSKGKSSQTEITEKEFFFQVKELIKKFISEDKSKIANSVIDALEQRLEFWNYNTTNTQKKRKNIQTEFIKNSLRKQRSPYAT